MQTITTSETLKTRLTETKTYFGAQIGIGQRRGNMKYEVAYSDFEDIIFASDKMDQISNC